MADWLDVDPKYLEEYYVEGVLDARLPTSEEFTNMRKGKYLHDYESWSVAERDFVKSNSRLMELYDSGSIPYSPSTYLWDENILFQPLAEAGLTRSAYNDFYEQWHGDWMQYNEDLLASGVLPYQIDPTPWDELTASDVAYQARRKSRYDTDTAAAAAEQEKQDAADAAETARLEQMDVDFETITELADLRGQSEVLAEADVNEYIAETTEYLKLRGVSAGFSEEKREELMSSRFTEYWSMENEQNLQDLAAKYVDTDYAEQGYELPKVSNRVWRKGSEEITPVPELLTPEEAVEDTVTPAGRTSLLSLLGIDEEETLASSILL